MMVTKVFDLSPSCESDQRAASVCARSVGTLPVCHGAWPVAQRGRTECDRKAGESTVMLYVSFK